MREQCKGENEGDEKYVGLGTGSKDILIRRMPGRQLEEKCPRKSNH